MIVCQKCCDIEKIKYRMAGKIFFSSEIVSACPNYFCHQCRMTGSDNWYNIEPFEIFISYGVTHINPKLLVKLKTS